MPKQKYERAVNRKQGKAQSQFACLITCCICFQSKAIITVPAIKNRMTKIKENRRMAILELIGLISHRCKFKATVRIL
jgi:hypothetical protein